ncbi:MAG: hypothetical protein HY795_15745 [Desulfovibrio sp.]|nr:hypothetical protein [Desulfovibrio sp.]MBI4958725.1 hypothetical protein [Desulfovibrio sp.]
MNLFFQFGSIISGIFAAYYWYESSIIKIPTHYGTISTTAMSLDGPVTYGTNPGLKKLAKSIRKQSRLNSVAARFTAFSILFQIGMIVADIFKDH